MWRGLVLAAQLLASARARVLVTAGPPGLLGHEAAATAAAAPLSAAEAARFAREGVAVVTSNAEWAYDSCPPRYVGSQELRGAIVIHLDPSLSKCTERAHTARGGARSLCSLGAVGWLYHRHATRFTLRMPGKHARKHAHVHEWEHDALSPCDAVSAVDADTYQLGPIVDAAARARAGAGARVRVRLEPGPNPWEAMWRSPALVVWQVVLWVHTLALLELALCHLYSFVREDGAVRLRSSIPQAVLALTIALALERCAYLAVDPMWSTARLDEEDSDVLLRVGIAFTLLSSVLFLFYFGDAARASGLASPRLTSGVVRSSLHGGTIVLLGVDVLCALVFQHLHAKFAPGMLETLATALRVLTLVVLPIVVLLISRQTTRAVCTHLGSSASRRAAAGLPAALLRKLCGRMRTALRLYTLAAAFGALLSWAWDAPFPMLAASFCFHATLNSIAYAQAGTFVPVGSRGVMPRGPLRVLWLALARRVRVVLPPGSALSSARASSARNSATVDPALELGGGSGGARRSAGAVESPARSCDSYHAQPPPESHALSVDGLPPPTVQHGISGQHGGLHLASDPVLLGVTLPFVRFWATLAKLPLDAPGYAVGERVASLTRDRDLTVAGLALADGLRAPTGRPAAGRATLFVSHAHACTLRRLLDALDAHVSLHGLCADTCFWIDLFCLRQHAQAEDVPRIAEVIAGVRDCIAVLDPWDRPVCLDRAWCLYEFLLAFRAGGQLMITVNPSERGRLVRALATDRAGVEHMLTQFDVVNAQTDNDDDHATLLTLVAEMLGDEDGDGDDGIARFNEQTHTALRSAIAGFSWNVSSD